MNAIPYGEIRHLVGRQHVGQTDDEIRQYIAGRTTSWPASAIKEAQDFAVECHHKNQDLVREFRL